MKKRRYEQLEDGQWFFVPKRGYKSQCCSCGHIHHITIREVEGRFQVKATTDNRATAAARRAFKFEKDE